MRIKIKTTKIILITMLFAGVIDSAAVKFFFNT